MQKTKVSGSALVFSLLVMFIILTAALGVASVSVIEQKNSSATGKSTQSFQVADSAVELILKKAALDPTGTTISSLGTGCADNVNGVVVDVSGSLGVASPNSVKVSFSDAAGVAIKTCATNLSQVAEVKAVGTYASTTRAISAAVAAGTLSWTTVSSGFSAGCSSDGTQVVKYAKDDRTGLVYLRGKVNCSSGTTFSITSLPIAQATYVYTSLAGNLTTPVSISIDTSGKLTATASSAFAAAYLGGYYPTN